MNAQQLINESNGRRIIDLPQSIKDSHLTQYEALKLLEEIENG